MPQKRQQLILDIERVVDKTHLTADVFIKNQQLHGN